MAARWDVGHGSASLQGGSGAGRVTSSSKEGLASACRAQPNQCGTCPYKARACSAVTGGTKPTVLGLAS